MSTYRSGESPEELTVAADAHLALDGGPANARGGRRQPDREATLLRQSREIARLTQLLEDVGGPRTAQAALAREHELARMRAKLMNPVTAAADLAERLALAHCQAGKPSLSKLADRVGCSKATLSKVFNNKMAPSWGLVRKLGVQLRVPTAIVNQDWHPLWMAADNYRRAQKTAGGVTARASAPVPGAERGDGGEYDVAISAGKDTGTGVSAALTGPTGYSCPLCGSWVVDTALHAGWHMQRNPDGQAAPDAESLGDGWNGESVEIKLLREALGTDES